MRPPTERYGLLEGTPRGHIKFNRQRDRFWDEKMAYLRDKYLPDSLKNELYPLTFTAEYFYNHKGDIIYFDMIFHEHYRNVLSKEQLYAIYKELRGIKYENLKSLEEIPENYYYYESPPLWIGKKSQKGLLTTPKE